MGIHHLRDLRDYWSTDPLLGAPGITAGMPFKPFQVLILSTLHLNDTFTSIPRDQPGYDLLHKIESLINTIEEKYLIITTHIRNAAFMRQWLHLRAEQHSSSTYH